MARTLAVSRTTVAGMVAGRMTTEAIRRAFPDLEPDNITQALRYGAKAVLSESCLRRGA